MPTYNISHEYPALTDEASPLDDSLVALFNQAGAVFSKHPDVGAARVTINSPVSDTVSEINYEVTITDETADSLRQALPGWKIVPAPKAASL